MLKNTRKLNYIDFINYISTSLMKNGKKKKFSFFFYMFQERKKKRYFKHMFILMFIVYKIRPLMELKTIRKGSQHYIFPVPLVKTNRSLKIGIRHMSKAIKLRRNYLLIFRIKYEFQDILKNSGLTWDWRNKIQEISADNISYSHYRWN